MSAVLRAWAIALTVTLATAFAIRYAFDPERAGDAKLLGALGGVYAVLGVATLVRLGQRGELAKNFRPMSGDVALAALTAGALYGVVRVFALLFLAHRTPREAWLMHVYAHIGDPEVSGTLTVTAAVFAVAALEELVWRGLVFRALEVAMTPGRALVLSTLLFSLAHLPAAWGLRDAAVGLNPLLPLAALGCGAVWCALVVRTRRLVPAILAHAFFTASLLEFPVWRL